ncbi:hypothetical protein [Streptomyces sp. NRRL S-495]|uniref:hypothetical protein n=1 Tax=Streptomyces sp. NRRL S-495 TaxID=1609133 RepID=UPI0005F94006|nr:hypothetical protein [Streptomyces sp. NRRL S-495]KJY36199.1 hypothetical protein VR45_11965 [Streptomyces sp. NRRL S-495]
MSDRAVPVGRNATRSTRLTPLARLPLALVLGASVLLSAAGPARAVDIPDYQAALDVVRSVGVHDAVCRFLATPLPGAGSETGSDTVVTVPDTAEPCAGLPAFTLKDPLAVHEITPDFVAGTALPVPTAAVRLSHLVSALGGAVNDRTATVLLAPTEGGGWHLAGVRDGDSDAGYAGSATPGSLVFTEPQIRGWYRLTLTTVEPLNDQAREGLDGKSAVPLADYQKLVKARYADKLPGTEYDTRGMSSGYGADGRAAEPSSRTPLLAGGSIVALALAGGVAALGRLRRRRRGTA